MNNNNKPAQVDDTAVAINPLDASPAVFKAGLDRRKANRDALMEWVRSSLVEGRDYGSIQINGRPSKPSLFKPGAEKIAGMLGLTATFPNLSRYEEAAMQGKSLNAIILKCELVNTGGEVIGQGVGARFVDQQDKGDLNKSLKMAVKSAMIDATLRCAGLSEIFTQDVEDTTTQTKPNPNSNGAASQKQLDTIRDLVENPDVTHEEKSKLADLLATGISKEKAKEILDHFLGKSELINGEWVRTCVGVLDQRRFN